MMLSDEDQRVLALHLGGVEDEEITRRGEQLLAESPEARAFAEDVRRMTAALGPRREDQAPLSDEELEPWMRLAREKFAQLRQSSAPAARRRTIPRSFWFVPAAAAAIVTGAFLWRFHTPEAPKAAPAAPRARIWMMPMSFTSGHTEKVEEVANDGVVSLNDGMGRAELGNAVIWLAMGSSFTLPKGRTEFELMQGLAVVDCSDSTDTVTVVSGTSRARLSRGGVMEVQAIPGGSVWTMYSGETVLERKAGPIRLRAGDSLSEVYETGDVLRAQVPADKPPNWLPMAKKAWTTRVVPNTQPGPPR